MPVALTRLFELHVTEGAVVWPLLPVDPLMFLQLGAVGELPVTPIDPEGAAEQGLPSGSVVLPSMIFPLVSSQVANVFEFPVALQKQSGLVTN